MTLIFSYLPAIQSLRMQNLSRQFYDLVLSRLVYSCPVEWRQNRRAIRACNDKILIEDHPPLFTEELFDI